MADIIICFDSNKSSKKVFMKNIKKRTFFHSGKKNVSFFHFQLAFILRKKEAGAKNLNKSDD